MSGWVTGLGKIAELLSEVMSWRQRNEDRDAGQDRGAAETTTVIAEMADERSAVDAAARGTDRDVAARLRRRLEADDDGA